MTVQVRIVTRRGRKAGQYRSLNAGGQWNSHWFHMTVPDAKKALRAGRAHIGTVPDCIVVPYPESR